MAHPSLSLINALRKTADRLRHGADYAWGNHGSCNCGNLLQVVTRLNKKEILTYAQTGIGEWTELAEESCAVTNAPFNLLIASLEKLGLTPTDIHNLEYLEDKEVLKRLPGGFRWLKKNLREDVILYFDCFADLLSEKLQDSTTTSLKRTNELPQSLKRKTTEAFLLRSFVDQEEMELA